MDVQADKSAETMWRYHVNMGRKVRGMLHLVESVPWKIETVLKKRVQYFY